MGRRKRDPAKEFMDKQRRIHERMPPAPNITDGSSVCHSAHAGYLKAKAEVEWEDKEFEESLARTRQLYRKMKHGV